MRNLQEIFENLGVESAPGQEVRQTLVSDGLKGKRLDGVPVDFSHGDVNAFPPIPGSIDTFVDGFEEGAEQAYTEYRGRRTIREVLSERLSEFTEAPIEAERELIVTPGTQGALFLAMGSCIGTGDKVAIVEPDYFANRKLVTFFGGEIVPVPMRYEDANAGSGLDLGRLEESFKQGVRLFVFSNPNNPTGVVYSHDEIATIAKLAQEYSVTVIVDELYSRQIFTGHSYTHLRAIANSKSMNLVTIIGPSKTESLSGFRLGVAIGSQSIIDRMEKLQAIVSLRAAGYCQAVLQHWFAEPDGWLRDRVSQHQAIRDDLVHLFEEADGFCVRASAGGSYLFPKTPPISLGIDDLCRALRLQAAVSVTPGSEFGPQFTQSFRINFSQDHAAAVDAIRRAIEVIGRYRA